jgi:hypothetical protein
VEPDRILKYARRRVAADRARRDRLDHCLELGPESSHAPRGR